MSETPNEFERLNTETVTITLTKAQYIVLHGLVDYASEGAKDGDIAPDLIDGGWIDIPKAIMDSLGDPDEEADEGENWIETKISEIDDILQQHWGR